MRRDRPRLGVRDWVWGSGGIGWDGGVCLGFALEMVLGMLWDRWRGLRKVGREVSRCRVKVKIGTPPPNPCPVSLIIYLNVPCRSLSLSSLYAGVAF